MSLHSDRLLCKECGGLCCRNGNITFQENPDPDWVKFIEVRGTRKIEVENGFIFLDNNRCPHINDSSDCEIQETKPKYCTDFPLNLSRKAQNVLSNVCPLLKSKEKEKENNGETIK